MDRLDCRDSQRDSACAVLRPCHRPAARTQRSHHPRGRDARLRTRGAGILRVLLGRMAAQLAAADRRYRLLRLWRARHRHAGHCVLPWRRRGAWHDRVPQPQPARSVDAGSRQRSRDQRARRRAGASGRRLGVGDLWRAVRSKRHLPRQYVEAAGDPVDLSGRSRGSSSHSRPVDVAYRRGCRRSCHRRDRGDRDAVPGYCGVPLGDALRFRRARLALVSARRSGLKPDRSVPLGAGEL